MAEIDASDSIGKRSLAEAYTALFNSLDRAVDSDYRGRLRRAETEPAVVIIDDPVVAFAVGVSADRSAVERWFDENTARAVADARPVHRPDIYDRRVVAEDLCRAQHAVLAADIRRPCPDCRAAVDLVVDRLTRELRSG